MGWAWKGEEAREQGDCTRFRGQEERPHCCEKEPVIIDLMPGTPYNMQSANCCKGGVLTSMTQDQTKRGATFQMTYDSAGTSTTNFSMPVNFTLGIPGYSCGSPFQVPPTKFTKDGHRWQQVLVTWNVSCIYSQFLASPAPKGCVSLSAFYNSTLFLAPHAAVIAKGYRERIVSTN